jgi:hypothetical protein
VCASAIRADELQVDGLRKVTPLKSEEEMLAQEAALMKRAAQEKAEALLAAQEKAALKKGEAVREASVMRAHEPWIELLRPQVMLLQRERRQCASKASVGLQVCLC